jgi:hypothetical protein
MVWDWTSPRHDGGPSFSGLAAIKFNEQPIGGRYEVFVPGQIVRGQPDATGEFRQHFGSVMFGAVRRTPRAVFWQFASQHQPPTLRRSGQGAAGRESRSGFGRKPGVHEVSLVTRLLTLNDEYNTTIPVPVLFSDGPSGGRVDLTGPPGDLGGCWHRCPPPVIAVTAVFD